MAKNIFAGFFQGFEDSRTFVLSLQFPPEGLALHGGVQIAAGSQTNDVLKALKPADLGDVELCGHCRLLFWFVGVSWFRPLPASELIARRPVAYSRMSHGRQSRVSVSVDPWRVASPAI